MPGHPTPTYFRDFAQGANNGAVVNGINVAVAEGKEKFSFSDNLTGKSMADIGKVLGQSIIEAMTNGINVNVVALNGQNFLFQDSGSTAGLAHWLVEQIFSQVNTEGNTSRVQLVMVDIKRNKMTDLFESSSSAPLTVNSKDGERVPLLEGATMLSVDSLDTAVSVIDAALNARACVIAQGGLEQVAHTVLQVHFTKISGAIQKTSVLSLTSVSVTMDETSLQFATMARDYGAGSKRLKNLDNLLLQTLRTSLGGNAHTFAYAAFHASTSPSTTELLVKTLDSLGKVKDTAAPKDFKVDALLADETKFAASVAKAHETVKNLWPSERAAMETKRSSMPHLRCLHTDRLTNGRNFLLLESGSKRAGRSDAKVEQDHLLAGLGIKSEHCVFSNVSGKLSVKPSEGADVLVNGKSCPSGKGQVLQHNDRIRLGAFLTYRVVLPGQIGPADDEFSIEMAEREVQDEAKSAQNSGISNGDISSAQHEKVSKLLPMVCFASFLPFPGLPTVHNVYNLLLCCMFDLLVFSCNNKSLCYLR
jgi:hypothetical protein